ncbi:unnamed protein product [Caenorhabditis sp. 36 PRJEB53466]|nr:unnamed protein product [Caenorhabditis sp. 36 PRJEB53466]
MSSSPASTSCSAVLSAPIFRPIAINPTLFPLKMELPVASFEDVAHVSLGSSTTSSSRCSSTESSSAPGKIRRGRPQQEIADGQDAHSQKKRHRRLYARQYRAQMRQKVENVKNLHDEKEQLEMEVKALRQIVSTLQNEVAQKDFLIGLLNLNRVNLS